MYFLIVDRFSYKLPQMAVPRFEFVPFGLDMRGHYVGEGPARLGRRLFFTPTRFSDYVSDNLTTVNLLLTCCRFGSMLDLRPRPFPSLFG